MKYLMTYAANTQAAPPTPERMAAIGKFGQEMAEAGVLLMTGGLVRPTKGTHIAMSAAGKFSVTDGPFAESKELIDGFALIRADSMEEALAHAQAFMAIAGEGEGEILQVFDAAEMQPKTPGK